MTTGPGDTFDVIVVLGGPNAAMRRRMAHAVRLFNQGRAAFLLLSGGGMRPRRECEVMRGLALAAGVPAERIVVEPRSRNTLQNALCSREIMARRGWTRALVVTDWPHLPRAVMSFRAVGMPVKGSGAPIGWASEPALALYSVAYEALALGWYAIAILSGQHRRTAQALAAKSSKPSTAARS